MRRYINLEYLNYHARFEVFTAVSMTNIVFWDIKTQIVPHRKHYVPATEPSLLTM
jgi:hypothetical protein